MRPHKKTNDYSEAELKQMLLDKLKLKHQQKSDLYQQKAAPYKHTINKPRFSKTDHQQRIEVYRQNKFLELPNKRSKAQLGFELILTLLELAALIVLVWLLIRGYQSLRTINADAQNTYAQLTPPVIVTAMLQDLSASSATPTPISVPMDTAQPTPHVTELPLSLATPQAQPTVLDFADSEPLLPSGHLPPGKQMGMPTNEALPTSMQFVNIATPKSEDAPSMAVWIKIPAIGVDHPIVQGDDDAALMQGVGQHLGSATPGSDGNVVLSAHNDIFGEIFRHLDQLVKGDEIILLTQSTQFTYIVEDIMILKPDAVSVLERGSEPIVTLISCYPYWIDTHRIVVRGILQIN